MLTRANLVLLIIVVGCALSAINANHRARKLYIELEAAQKHMRDLDVEWGQLQLEQSTWASHARVEKVARERLDMRPPAPGQILAIDPEARAARSRP
jgi:cell division protein FtsL